MTDRYWSLYHRDGRRATLALWLSEESALRALDDLQRNSKRTDVTLDDLEVRVVNHHKIRGGRP